MLRPITSSAECPQGHICYWEVMTCDARNIPPETLPPAPGETDSPSKAPFSGPTKIPTYMPIPPPDPLPFPSDDPTDREFVGVDVCCIINATYKLTHASLMMTAQIGFVELVLSTQMKSVEFIALLQMNVQWARVSSSSFVCNQNA